jgi:DNA-binding IclR family transcriptional regulator
MTVTVLGDAGRNSETLAPEPVQVDPRDPVAQRILSVLEACAATRRPITITQLASATHLAKSTVHRMCWKLEHLGLLDHTERGFEIGTKLLSLANANPVVTQLRTVAMPHLVDLQTLAGASNLAVLVDGKALIVDGLYTSSFRQRPFIGRGLPLHCTAVGKALLAQLEEGPREKLLSKALPAATRRSVVDPMLMRRQLHQVAECGVAMSNEEFQHGLVGVAAAFPVREGMIAAIGCVGSSSNSQLVQRSMVRVTAAATRLRIAFEKYGVPA